MSHAQPPGAAIEIFQKVGGGGETKGIELFIVEKIGYSRAFST